MSWEKSQLLKDILMLIWLPTLLLSIKRLSLKREILSQMQFPWFNLIFLHHPQAPRKISFLIKPALGFGCTFRFSCFIWLYYVDNWIEQILLKFPLNSAVCFLMIGFYLIDNLRAAFPYFSVHENYEANFLKPRGCFALIFITLYLLEKFISTQPFNWCSPICFKLSWSCTDTKCYNDVFVFVTCVGVFQIQLSVENCLMT